MLMAIVGFFKSWPVDIMELKSNSKPPTDPQFSSWLSNSWQTLKMTSLTSQIGNAKLAGHFDPWNPSRSALDDQTDRTLVVREKTWGANSRMPFVLWPGPNSSFFFDLLFPLNKKWDYHRTVFRRKRQGPLHWGIARGFTLYVPIINVNDMKCLWYGV